MRLGGKVFEKTADPKAWAQAVRKLGYRAAYCPVEGEVDDATARAYGAAAAEADLVIAEVGAWSNPIAPDDKTRAGAIEKCQRGLDLAERVGAVCCVNVAGSRGGGWHAENFSRETFDLIVESVRKIIDAVKPKRARYTLETKPTVFPTSAEEYLDLIEAIDRPAFAAHLDAMNMVNTPARLYRNRRFLETTIRVLGPHIVSCHVKDVTIKATSRQLVHLDECPPGTGQFDLATYLRELGRLGADLPLMIEHLDTAEEFEQAANHLRGLARAEGVAL